MVSIMRVRIIDNNHVFYFPVKNPVECSAPDPWSETPVLALLQLCTAVGCPASDWDTQKHHGYKEKLAPEPEFHFWC